ncbi:MAG: ABC transporter substrate-binding protein, partial [Lentisphaeria bacterium]|nr:ABC transporter substrate-binding protein [Lentisphaeria bacterium]
GTPRIFTSDVVFRGALFEAGIDPEKDLTIVEFKRPVDVLEAVKSGKVDVGIGATNIIGQSVQAGLASPLWSNDLWPNHPCCRIVVTEEALQKYRPELVKFLKAELLAEKKFVDDPQSGVRADVEQQKFGEKLASDLVLNPHLQFSVDPNRKGVEAMWAHMKKIGYADGDPDFSKVIDTTLYYEALQELRKEQPDEPFWEKLEQRYKDQNL